MLKVCILDLCLLWKNGIVESQIRHHSLGVSLSSITAVKKITITTISHAIHWAYPYHMIFEKNQIVFVVGQILQLSIWMTVYHDLYLWSTCPLPAFEKPLGTCSAFLWGGIKPSMLAYIGIFKLMTDTSTLSKWQWLEGKGFQGGRCPSICWSTVSPAASKPVRHGCMHLA